MKIKFHETMYELFGSPVQDGNRLNVMLNKSDELPYNFLITEDTLNITDVTVYEDDGETVNAVYSGFTNRIAFTILEDFISIEFETVDLAQQVAALMQSLQQIQEIQDTHQEALELMDAEKLDSSILGEGEHIGQPSKNSYVVGDTFPADGSYYKAVANITAGNRLVENGNCELTTINEEIIANKNEESNT